VRTPLITGGGGCGDSLYWQAGLCVALSCEMAGENRRSRSAPPRGVLLPAVRCVAVAAPGRAARAVDRGQEARGVEIVTPDPVHWPDPSGTYHSDATDATSFSYQATAMDLHRFWDRTHSSADHHSIDGKLQRSKRQISIRGLNRNHNHDLKNLFKSAATVAAAKPGPFQEFYDALVTKGIKPEMARLTLARKIAAITLTIWKKGVRFDSKYLKPQTA